MGFYKVEIVTIGSYKVGTAERPIFTTFSANNSSKLILFTLSTSSLAVLL